VGKINRNVAKTKKGELTKKTLKWGELGKPSSWGSDFKKGVRGTAKALQGKESSRWGSTKGGKRKGI